MRGGGIATLIISTLDECPDTGPVMHINVESKAHWHAITDDLPQFETRPTDMAATLKSLNPDTTEHPANKMKSDAE